jgi:hypothetical protein
MSLKLSTFTSAVSELIWRKTTTCDDFAVSFIPPANIIACSAVTFSRITLNSTNVPSLRIILRPCSTAAGWPVASM